MDMNKVNSYYQNMCLKSPNVVAIEHDARIPINLGNMFLRPIGSPVGNAKNDLLEFQWEDREYNYVAKITESDLANATWNTLRKEITVVSGNFTFVFSMS